MPLWLRLTLAALVAAVAPLIVLGVQAVELTGAQAEAARRAALEREAVAISEEVGRWVEHQEQALGGWMALYPDLADRPQAQQRGLLRAVYRAVPSVVAVALVDDRGALLRAEGQALSPVLLEEEPGPEDPLHGRTLGSQDRLAAWLVRVEVPPTDQSAFATHPWRPTGSGVPAVPIAVRSPFAGERAVLAADVSMAPVKRILQMRSSGPFRVSLYDNDGDEVIVNGDAIDGRQLRPLLSQDLAYISLPETGIRGGLAAVPGVGWSVVVAETSSGLIEVDDPRSQLLIALIISLLVALVVGFIVARPLSRPIGRLRQAAHTIAEGNLSHRVPEQGGPEVVELARAFNDMAQRLAGSLAAVEAYNAELEDRVSERTAELQAAQRELVRAGQLAAVAEVGAGLAHELNNPLAGILGLAQVLRAGSSDPMEQGLLEQVETQTQRCREVVDAMLRLSSGGTDLHDEPVIDVVVVLQDSAALVRGSARQRGVELVVEDMQGPLPVRLDPVQGSRILTQILQALCAGLSSGATLRLGAEALDDQIVVRFVPDHPVAVGQARDDFMASGLGLWVARQMLDARSGQLRPPTNGGLAWQVLLPKA